MVGLTLIFNWYLYLCLFYDFVFWICVYIFTFVYVKSNRSWVIHPGGPLSHFHAFTLSLVHIADVAGENLVHLVDEHEHVAVLFYNSLDKSTKKVIGGDQTK